MTTPPYPGVYIVETPSGVQTITGVATSIGQPSCSRPATGTYKLDKGDKFDAFEWDISRAESDEAVNTIEEVQTPPGTYSKTHQCTSVALEVGDAAGLTSIPRGKGSIGLPLCGDVEGVPTPSHSNKSLKQQKQLCRKLMAEDFADTGLPFD